MFLFNRCVKFLSQDYFFGIGQVYSRFRKYLHTFVPTGEGTSPLRVVLCKDGCIINYGFYYIYMALRWRARMDPGFSIDMLLRWSKEVSLETKTSSRQRRDISIEINVIRRCTPAECYVYR